MALVYADRVRETTTTTGTGTLTLAGAATGYRAFSSVLSNGDTCYGFVAHQTADEWEVCLFTYSAGTLARTTTLASSNGGSAVNFSAGTKDAMLDVPAERIAALLGARTANYVFAGPTSGGAAVASFRALVAADIPDLSSAYASLPVADTQTLVKGSADATKLLRIEVDGFTTGTTRVLTPPNADATIAGLEVAQTFTVAQTFNEGIRVNASRPADVTIQGLPSNPTQFSGIWFAQASPDNSNFSFLGDGTNTYLNSATNLFVRSGNTTIMVVKQYRTILGFNLDGSEGVTTAALSVIPPNASYSGIVLLGNVSQSGNMLEIRDSSGNVQAIEAPDGSATRRVRDAGTTNTPSTLTLGHNSSNTPATGFGSGLHFQLESSTTEDRDAGALQVLWDVATDASRAAEARLVTYYTSTAQTGFRQRSASGGVQHGAYGVTPVSRPSAYTQTYATADKTHANLTSATLTDNSGGTANTTVQALTDPADTPITADALRDDLVANLIPELRNNFADLTAQINALRVDLEDVKQLVNSVIDDLQSEGWLQ